MTPHQSTAGTTPQNWFMRGHHAHLADNTSWHDQAACRDASRDLFFPDGAHHLGEALRLCHACPVRLTCLTHALEREHHGIWGGFSGRALRRIRKHRDGRPWADVAVEVLADPDSWTHAPKEAAS